MLVIDDDVRNVFAITGMLELDGMTVLHAPNGRKGIELLLANDGVDLILMDVMMPEMDGYATTAAIREMPQFARPADHRRDRQGHAGRPGEEPGLRRRRTT